MSEGLNADPKSTLDVMEACLANNSPAARSRAQFRNVMESLIAVARQGLRRAPSAMLAEFHEAVGHPATDALWLRRTLHDEEHAELAEALEQGDLAHIARELADVVYVAFGTACAYGIDLDAALAEVHRANMHKATAGLRREDGKVIKPPDFVAPDMTEAIRNAG